MTEMTTDRQARKEIPMARGLLDYFPDALIAVAELSFIGNEQHNPGEELHWAKDKSTDHADCILRHLIERGAIDTDGVRHATKVAWRGLALLQIELDKVKAEDKELLAKIDKVAEIMDTLPVRMTATMVRESWEKNK